MEESKGKNMGKSEELTAKGFLKKLVGFSAASWFSAAISFLVTPVFTRIYLPEEVGHINLFTTYMTFFQTVCVLALDQAFMRFYNEDMEGIQKNNFLRYCLKFNMGVAMISAVVVLLGHRYFSLQISGEENYFIPMCLAAVIACGTFLRMSSVSSRMEKNMVQYTIQIILVALVEKVIFILVAFYNPNHKPAILGMTTGYLLLSAVILGMKRNVLRPVKGVPRKTTFSILKFAIPYVPVLVLSWLNNSTPLFVLKRYVDYTAVGIYTNAVTIANILHLVQTGFSTYWNPFIYEYYKDETSKDKIVRIERLAVFVLIFSAMCIIIFQDFIYLLVGSKFRASKVFFPFLMLTPICNCIADMAGAGIMLSKKSYLNIFTFLGSTSVNLAVSTLLVPRIGIMGAGIAVGLSASVMLLIRSYLGGKYYKISADNRFIVYTLGYMGGACVVNMVCISNIMRYSLLLLLLGGVCWMFRKEIQYCCRFAIQEWKIIHNKWVR